MNRALIGRIVAALSLAAMVASGEARAELPTLSIGDAHEAHEGDGGSGQLAFTITLSAHPAPGHDVAFQIATSDATATATAGPCDGTFDYGDLGEQTITFGPADPLERTFQVTTCGDTRDEPDEEFHVFIYDPLNATILDGDGLGVIEDDDDPPTLRIEDASAPEGAGQINFRVLMSAVSGKDIVVPYSVRSTASTAHAVVGANCNTGVDVQDNAQTLVIPSGQNGGTIHVPLCADAAAEDNETFFVTLSRDNTQNAAVSHETAVGTILNDDLPTVSVQKKAQRSEGSPATGNNGLPNGLRRPIDPTSSAPSRLPLEFIVSLDHPTTQPVSVTWKTVDGTADGGAQCRHVLQVASGVQLPPSLSAALTRVHDFLEVGSETVIIPPQALSVPLKVTTCMDFNHEADETFTVTLDSAINARLHPTDTIAEGKLVDDD